MSEIVVMATGPLHGGTVDRLARDLAEAVADRPARLVVDLTACTRIDAAAVEALLRAHSQMLRNQGTLALRRPQHRVRRTLRLARVDHVLEVEDAAPLADAR